MKTIDISKIPDRANDVFNDLTPPRLVKDALKAGRMVNHVEYDYGTYSTVEMRSGEWVTVPNDAIVDA